jgi:hypothetical protein
MIRFILKIDTFLGNLKAFDFIGLFFLRVYLFFIFWNAGVRKIAWEDGIPNVDRFSEFLGPGGKDNLNLILPDLFAWLTVIAEAGGAVLLINRSFLEMGNCTHFSLHDCGYLLSFSKRMECRCWRL